MSISKEDTELQTIITKAEHVLDEPDNKLRIERLAEIYKNINDFKSIYNKNRADIQNSAPQAVTDFYSKHYAGIGKLTEILKKAAEKLLESIEDEAIMLKKLRDENRPATEVKKQQEEINRQKKVAEKSVLLFRHVQKFHKKIGTDRNTINTIVGSQVKLTSEKESAEKQQADHSALFRSVQGITGVARRHDTVRSAPRGLERKIARDREIEVERERERPFNPRLEIQQPEQEFGFSNKNLRESLSQAQEQLNEPEFQRGDEKHAPPLKRFDKPLIFDPNKTGVFQKDDKKPVKKQKPQDSDDRDKGPRL